MSNPLNGILGSSGGGSGGSGDVVGPASSVDDQIAVFDGVTGKLLSTSAATLTAAGSLTIPAGQTVAISSSSVNSASLFQATTANPAFSGQILFNDNASWLFRNNGLAAAAPIAIGTAGATLAPASQLYWSSSATEGNLRPAFADTGLARSAAGVVKVTDGGAGAGSILVKGGATSASVRFGGSTAAEPALGSHAATSTGNVHAFKADVSDWTGVNASEFLFSNTGRGFNPGGGTSTNTSIGDNGFRALNTAETDYAPIAGSIISAKTINGAQGNVKIATTTVNASGATSTATNLVPAGCILLGVTTRVTTAITSGDGGTSVNIGNGTDADMYGAAIAFALGTTTNLASHTASALAFVSAAQNVVFTCVGGTFNGGVWRVCAHYLDLTAPTS